MIEDRDVNHEAYFYGDEGTWEVQFDDHPRFGKRMVLCLGLSEMTDEQLEMLHTSVEEELDRR